MKKACNQAQNQCTIWNPKFDQVGTMYWKETRQSFKQLQCKEKEHKLEEKKKKPMQQEKKERRGLWVVLQILKKLQFCA
jgi:hypothetical protein